MRSFVHFLTGLALAFVTYQAEGAPWQSPLWDVAASGSGVVRRPAPIRNIIQTSSGTLLGTRPAGQWIELWRSVNDGFDWTRLDDIAFNTSVEFGDSTLFELDGGELLAGFRERHPTLGWSVRVSRSVDQGASWSFAGTIHDWTGTLTDFVGAPDFLQLTNGQVQAYYDSEPLAPGGDQYIGVKTGAFDPQTELWNWSNERIVNMRGVSGAPVRDGLASVVNLGPDSDGVGDRLMVVTEGIGIRLGQAHNIVRAFQVENGGLAQLDWNNLLDSRVVYQSPLFDPAGHRYNAYAPYAIQVNGGTVLVAFSTDEGLAEFGLPADIASTPPDDRHSEIKFVTATADSSFTQWSAPTTIWGLDHPTFNGSIDAGDIFNYQIGLVELAPNDLLATLDLFAGRQLVFRPLLGLGPGDYDQDGSVDVDDYLVWLNSFHSTTELAADGNGDGIVNTADYVVWRNHLDESVATGLTTQAIPEPGSAALVLGAMVIAGSARRRTQTGTYS